MIRYFVSKEILDTVKDRVLRTKKLIHANMYPGISVPEEEPREIVQVGQRERDELDDIMEEDEDEGESLIDRTKANLH